jgi:hypothetical protein
VRELGRCISRQVARVPQSSWWCIHRFCAYLPDDRLHAAEDRFLYIVMEYCNYQDLASKIKRYTQRKEYMDERVVWVPHPDLRGAGGAA